jgi:hypothetical protein
MRGSLRVSRTIPTCCTLLHLAAPCCTLLHLAAPCCTLLHLAAPAALASLCPSLASLCPSLAPLCPSLASLASLCPSFASICPSLASLCPSLASMCAPFRCSAQLLGGLRYLRKIMMRIIYCGGSLRVFRTIPKIPIQKARPVVRASCVRLLPEPLA